MPRRNWRVKYKNGYESVRLTFKDAISTLYYQEGLYIEKVSGWWRVGRKIYRRGPAT